MPSEAQIQSAILDYLAARRVLAWRMNIGAAKMGNRFVRFGVPGMADILAAPRNLEGWPRFLWIEVKSPTGKQTAEQESFQEQVEEQDHTYIVARSIEDVERWL